MHLVVSAVNYVIINYQHNAMSNLTAAFSIV